MADSPGHHAAASSRSARLPKLIEIPATIAKNAKDSSQAAMAVKGKACIVGAFEHPTM